MQTSNIYTQLKKSITLFKYLINTLENKKIKRRLSKKFFKVRLRAIT